MQMTTRGKNPCCRSAAVLLTLLMFSMPGVSPLAAQSPERNLRCVVLGEVHKPGQYLLDAPSTVGVAVRKAGGLKRAADAVQVTIARRIDGKLVRFRADLESALEDDDIVEVRPVER